MEINEENSTKWDFLSLLQIKYSIPSTWKNIQEDNTDALNCPLPVSDLLPAKNQFLNKYYTM